mmetsp:Transcript_22612/g.32553  ORF Transcript_22612/g.32553 Transcript_22612/m.32553 type:complete len:91 (+) Transcript_22612:40-312(+)
MDIPRIQRVPSESLIIDFESTTAKLSGTAPCASYPKQRSEPAAQQSEAIDANMSKQDSHVESLAPERKAMNRKRARLNQSSEIDDIFGDL